MDDVTFVSEKKYKRMKRIVIAFSIIAGIVFAFMLYIIVSIMTGAPTV